ncbi:MAG: glutaredoxin 3 [Neisseria sp.]|nr:glutaredoxin 3 [Neisseria sp.]
MQPVTIYTGPHCPYCNMAKALLKQLGVNELKEINAIQNPAAFEAMRQTTGTRTVPQIFIGDTHVGGFTDLRALHNGGRLLPLLQQGGSQTPEKHLP